MDGGWKMEERSWSSGCVFGWVMLRFFGWICVWICFRTLWNQPTWWLIDLCFFTWSNLVSHHWFGAQFDCWSRKGNYPSSHFSSLASCLTIVLKFNLTKIYFRTLICRLVGLIVDYSLLIASINAWRYPYSLISRLQI